VSSATDLTQAREVARAAWSPSRLDVALFGTPLLVTVNVHGSPPMLAFVGVLAILVWTRRRVREAPWTWLGLAAVVGIWQAPDFVRLDDHNIVTTYWCAAVGLALLAEQRERALAWTATLLIGLVFAFAAFWKLTSGQFVDGRFFRFTLIWDERFDHLRWATGNTHHAAERGALDVAMDGARAGAAVHWVEGPRSRAVAEVMTWWGVLIESAVAITFLVPLRRMQWLRHIALFAFMIGTYYVVPITGFGCLLCIMAAVTTDDVRWRRAYLLAFAFLFLVWTPIWEVLFF
jgi:hypothetical protein